MTDETKAAMAWSVRPLTTGEVLTDALRLLRSDPWRLCGTMGVVIIPANLIMAAVLYLFMRQIGRSPHMDPNVALMGILYFGALLLATAALWGLVVPFAQVALVRAITDRYLGRPVSIGRAYLWLISNFWMVASTIVLMALVISAGFTLFFFPGPIVALLLMMTVPVMVTENRGGFYALQRSFQLVSQQPMKLILLVVVAWGIGVALTSLPNLLLPQPQMENAPEDPNYLFEYYNATALITAISTAIAGITNSVVRTIRGAVYLLAYFDARCRSEGFDIEFEARKAGVWGVPEGSVEVPGG
jgi:hypothetical protein